MNDIEAELAELLADRGVRQRIDRDTHLVRDLALDSLQQLELVVAIENRFRVSLTPEDEAGLATVGDVARLIAARREAARRG